MSFSIMDKSHLVVDIVRSIVIMFSFFPHSLEDENKTHEKLELN